MDCPLRRQDQKHPEKQLETILKEFFIAGPRIGTIYFSPMFGWLRALWRDESGPTAVEYALMLAAVTGVIIAVVIVFGNKVNKTFESVYNHYP